MKNAICFLLLAGLFGGCTNKENAVPSQAELSASRAKLAFTCTHEADHLPSLDPEADQLFRYGLYLEKLEGPKDFDAAARYYRIAAAYGHYKANHNLQLLVSQGMAKSPDAPGETIDLVEQLIKAGVPGGYYDMGHYLELGYGVKQDADKARRFLRQAADRGSPEAQAYVADLLAPADRAPDIARQMRQCAVDQGYGKAAGTLGINLKNNSLYPEAIKIFQKGVEVGDSMSASFLADGFKGPPSTNRLNYLALSGDAERARRYELIWRFLIANEGGNPKVPDLNQIVPLPPAKLPPWDGTFQWQKEQEAAVPPPKPPEELVERLSKAKGFDPSTGLPLSANKTSQVKRLPLGTVAQTGKRCPEDGVWCAKQWAHRTSYATQTFSRGEVMPALAMDNPRLLPGLDTLLGMRKCMLQVSWKPVSYNDQA